jgi:hypothetical protein
MRTVSSLATHLYTRINVTPGLYVDTFGFYFPLTTLRVCVFFHVLKVHRDSGMAHTGGERSYPSVSKRALEVMQPTNVLGNCQDPYVQRQIQCLYDRRIKHAHK